jgi:hypothetical protein
VGDARVVFDGERIEVAGRAPQRDPIAQARGASAWLSRLLRESTGRSFAVRGVVAYPDWYVDSSRARGSSVWVLEPKAIAAWIEHQAVSLPDEDVAMIADRVREILGSCA